MEDYVSLKKKADKVNAENTAAWGNNATEIKEAVKKAQQCQEYLKKALETHVNNAKMATAEYGGWSKLATGIIEKQAKLEEAKKNKDKAAIADLEKEIKKLDKAASAYQTNIQKGVEKAQAHLVEVRKRMAAIRAITL